MKKLLILIGLSITLPVLADKIVINGAPIIIEHTQTGYTIPVAYSNKAYNYATIDGKNRVCYSDKQPNLNNLNVITINVTADGKVLPWNCYEFDDTIFEIIH